VPDPIPVPPELLRATRISWTMDMAHGLAESPFSGQGQTQRGLLERWKFEMTIQRMNRRRAQIAQGFFMELEGNLGTFLMHDPASAEPLGRALGSPVLAANAAARAATISVAGWVPNISCILHAGDWVQIGEQLCKVVKHADSSPDGTCGLTIWPKLMLPLPAGTVIKTRPAQGIFRFTSDLPAWEADAANLLRNYTIALTGTQVVLLP
jgi:hypothetical protein